LKVPFVSRGGYGDTFEALFYLRVGHGFQIKESFKDTLKIKEFQRLPKLLNKKRASKTSKTLESKESFKDFKDSLK
jgi:hypothetical protein